MEAGNSKASLRVFLLTFPVFVLLSFVSLQHSSQAKRGTIILVSIPINQSEDDGSNLFIFDVFILFISYFFYSLVVTKVLKN